MNVELRVIDWRRLRKQQRQWIIRNHRSFVRRWFASVKEIVL